MANPTKLAVATIKTQVATIAGGFAGNTDTQLLSQLNAPAIANPAAQGQVPAPLSEAALIPLLSPSSLASLTNFVNLGLLKADLDGGNRAAMGLWSARLAAAGIITQAEAAAINAYVASTVADPAWQPQISWAQATLGRPADAHDLAVARAS